MFSEIRRAAMTPVWIAQLATGTKSFERNAVIGSRRLNEWGLHAARVGLAYRLAQARRRQLAGLVSEEDRTAFDRDGFVLRSNFLHAETLHPPVKAWLCLTEVAEDAGPFSYVPGSHRLTPQRLEWERRMSLSARHSSNAEDRQGSFRIDPAELASLGLPQPHVFAVPANTLIVADTFGFHARGPSERPSLRVEVWAYGRRSPFLPWAALVPWTTSALGRRSIWSWKFGDAVERAGLKKNRWRARTGLSAFDPPSQ